MKRFRNLMVSVLALLAFLLIAAIMFDLAQGPKQAYYQGKSSSYWLCEIFATNGKQKEAIRAFREMGTNADPVLLDAFTHREPSPTARWVHSRLASVPYLGRYFPPLPNRKELRSAAEIVVQNTSSSMLTPALLQLLNEANSEVRKYVLGAVKTHFGPTNCAQVPLLVAVLNDADPLVRQDALVGLGGIGPSASNACPAITQACRDPDLNVRITAAWDLWQIAHETNIAVPVLHAALSQANAESRHWSACYLQAMEGTSPALLSIFLQSLTNSEQGVRLSACALVRSYGPEAAAAVPILIAALRDPSQEMRTRARAALQAIDPETAAAIQP